MLKLKQHEQKIWLLSCLFLLVVCSQFVISFIEEREKHKIALDQRLLNAAEITDLYISGDEYHSGLGKESLSETEERSMADKLTALAISLDLAYIYTMKIIDGEIKFISSSLTPQEAAGAPYTHVYWRTYDDADPAIWQAASTGDKTFASYSDQWGDFRSVFLARKASDGSPYIIGVDLPQSKVKAITHISAKDALQRSVLFFVLCVPFLLYGIRITQAAYSRRREELLKDELTGLQNKRALLEDIDDFDHPSLVILNIDRFREVSHAYSFEVGDTVLAAFAYNLFNYQHPKVKKIKAYRLHSDEFVVLVNLPYEYDERLAIFQDFYKFVTSRKYRMPDEKYISFRITAGISHGKSPKLFNQASIALSLARETHTSVVPYEKTAGMPERYLQNLERNEQVKLALQEERLIPFFHPIVSTETGDIEKYEVLARLIDEQNQVVMMPDEFIPVLKGLRLYNQFSLALLSRAIETAEQEQVDISFNISTKDISSETSFTCMLAMVKASGIASRIHFELLESDSLVAEDKLIDAITALKRLGCRVGLDDLGKEYSNFDRLTSLPIDFVKLDRSVMPNLRANSDAAQIAENVIRFSREKRITTVAEFCSTRELCVAAKMMGVEFVQGFYLAEPSREIVRNVNCF